MLKAAPILVFLQNCIDLNIGGYTDKYRVVSESADVTFRK
jgi:hypothetical protein